MDEDEKKMKKIKIIIIVLMILMLLLCSGAIVALAMLQSETFKFKMDGVSQKDFSEEMFDVENNNLYVSIKDFAELMGYETYVGEYKQFEEDDTKCYIRDKYQIVSFEYDSDLLYKTTPGNDSEYEYLKIDEPVKKVNNKLYISAKGASVAFNAIVNYDSGKKTAEVVTMKSLITKYASISEKYFDLQDEELSPEEYNNAKALLYGYVIVKNEAGEMGITDINGKEIVGKKYADIKFLENNGMFYVKISDQKMGMISSDGITRIKPEYTNIIQLDKDLGYYIVTKNNKKGIVDEKGNILLYIEYDNIGIDSNKFEGNVIKNQYLIYSNYIPVQKNKKWGVKVISNSTIKDAIPEQYDDIGSTQSQAGSGIALIPDYKGFVFKKGDKFGIVNIKGDEMVPFALESVYSSVSEGKLNYWMIYDKNTINVLEYLKNFYPTPNAEAQTTTPDNNTAPTAE